MRQFAIRGRRNLDSISFASRDDFDVMPCDENASLTDVTGGVDFLVYCADFDAQCLFYTDNSAPLRSQDVPFLYLAQRRTATTMIEVPFQRLHEITSPPMTPTFIITPGRCGSTLLVRLLLAAGVAAVSEPDSFSNLAIRLAAKPAGIVLPFEQEMLRASVTTFRAGWGTEPVVKLRGVCCLIVKQLLSTFPSARFIFVLRDRMRWLESQSRAFGFNARALSFLLRLSILAVHQVASLGRPSMIVWYEDLVQRPLEVLANIVPSDMLNARKQQVLEAFSQDAQADSPLERASLAPHRVNAEHVLSFEARWHLDRPIDLIDKHGLERLA